MVCVCGSLFFLFSPAACRGPLFYPAPLLWGGNLVLDVHFGGGPLCHAGVHHLPRHDGGNNLSGRGLRSEMLEPKEFRFEDSNYYYAALKDTIEGAANRAARARSAGRSRNTLANGRRPSMIKTIKTMSKQEKERYTVPRKVQDVIPRPPLSGRTVFFLWGTSSPKPINSATSTIWWPAGRIRNPCSSPIRSLLNSPGFRRGDENHHQ